MAALQLLVPPAEGGRECRAHKHLVDWGVELNSRESLSKIPSISGEQGREIRILEVADPVWHPEMAQVDDGHNVAPLQVRESQIDKLPIVLTFTDPRLVN